MRPPETGVVLPASVPTRPPHPQGGLGAPSGAGGPLGALHEGRRQDFQRVLSSRKLQDQPRLGVGEVTPRPPKGGEGESHDKEACVRDGWGLL